MLGVKDREVGWYQHNPEKYGSARTKKYVFRVIKVVRQRASFVTKHGTAENEEKVVGDWNDESSHWGVAEQLHIFHSDDRHPLC